MQFRDVGDPLAEDRDSSVVTVLSVVGLMKEAIAQCMVPNVTNAAVLIISSKFVILGMPLPARSKEGRVRTRRKASSETDGHLGNSKGKGKGGGGGTPGKKKPFYKDKKKAYAVTLKRDSVPSAPQEGEAGRYESNKGKVKSENSVLSGPPKAGTFNSFACDAVHSKLSHTHNESNAPSKRLYTDTDPSSQTEIITDIQVKKPACMLAVSGWRLK